MISLDSDRLTWIVTMRLGRCRVLALHYYNRLSLRDIVKQEAAMSDEYLYGDGSEDSEYRSILTGWEDSLRKLTELITTSFKHRRSEDMRWHHSYLVDIMLTMLGRLMTFTSDLDENVTDHDSLKREYQRLQKTLEELAFRTANEIDFLKRRDRQGGFLNGLTVDVPMLSLNYDLEFVMGSGSKLRDPYKVLTRDIMNPGLNDYLPLDLKDEFRIIFMRKHPPEISSIELELYSGGQRFVVYPVKDDSGKVIDRQSKIPFFKRERSTLFQLVDSINDGNGIPAPSNSGKLFANLNLLIEKVLLINNFVLETENPKRWMINPLYASRIDLRQGSRLLRKGHGIRLF